ncbi:MAG: class I SAM-dependent methyltransferase [Candidatus Freyrarchaeum guaymaensis]|nr:class I SAM-dependent methyltransferase [Candidatus Freyarchaeota archaeon]
MFEKLPDKKQVIEYDDAGVIPVYYYPDTDYLFRMMGVATIDMALLRKKELALDVGCGIGKEAGMMADRGARVVGVDPSKIMVKKARDWLNSNNQEVSIVRGAGEYLPFRSDCFDVVTCKGAMDHFASPRATMREFSRILKPSGRAVISLANFESLGFKLARRIHALRRRLKLVGDGPTPWDVPEDHTVKFDYLVVKAYMDGVLRRSGMRGLSMFWNFPWWGRILNVFPKRVSWTILRFVDGIAKLFPMLGDIIIARGTPIKR